MSISAKGMAITGIDDRRYWNWIPTEESRLASEILVLAALVYLRVGTGTFETSKPKIYRLASI